MAFTSIVIVIVVIYVFGYVGMIVYDLFLKKEPVEFMPKPKDVEIDISDEAGQFKPITVGNDEPKHQPAIAQRPAYHKPDEGIAAAQSNTDGQVEESSEEQKSATTSAESYSPSAIPFRSDNDNTEGKPSSVHSQPRHLQLWTFPNMIEIAARYMFHRRNWLFLSASHWHRNSIPIWISIISWNN